MKRMAMLQHAGEQMIRDSLEEIHAERIRNEPCFASWVEQFLKVCDEEPTSCRGGFRGEDQLPMLSSIFRGRRRWKNDAEFLFVQWVDDLLKQLNLALSKARERQLREDELQQIKDWKDRVLNCVWVASKGLHNGGLYERRERQFRREMDFIEQKARNHIRDLEETLRREERHEEKHVQGLLGAPRDQSSALLAKLQGRIRFEIEHVRSRMAEGLREASAVAKWVVADWGDETGFVGPLRSLRPLL